MPLPWKKSKSGRITRFVSDLQQSPKRGGSLVVETGFPTSLIDLFVKNRDRLKKSSSKRNNEAQTQTVPTRLRVPSPPPPSLPQKLDPPSVTAASKIEEIPVSAESIDDGDSDGNGDRRGGGGGCVLTVVVIKVFFVAVLALSTKKLALGITLSAFSLLFLELLVARVFNLPNLRPDPQVRLHSLIGRNRKEKLEESSLVSFEIVESFEESRDCVEEASTLDEAKPVAEEEREMQEIRDVVFTKEKSKSGKLKSKIVKKLRSYKKKRKTKLKEKEEAQLGVEVVEEEEETYVREVSSLYPDDRIESEVSVGSNDPPLLESCEEIEKESGSKGDQTKAVVMIVIALAGLLSGKVLAIGLTLPSCLILKLVCCRFQTRL
ncbi:ethylene-responsive nuclear protein / ethylene-regulated nuclear protein (ERT2) [Raphanus sativus]|uniref:Uncharacterized protein LOC108853825 n=1 Tax=Raphanus sativus TaxID=3726 RepID=A0A6J0NF60_RAPSA|nr:uncharacterized protein LOC108853825 [Raphanus sativus]XP_056856378.1 uncharacterized protein LOC130505791 [Raphanus sativus]KAJ4867676.1 ethylene-responsive nuclear protein / ethylene-regulated nuclear protein (ERT2) [Raphanus sativus]KAJ4899840.1 ethylene-responsive nuclear protein / ethylene-regulated nuclear protein (ERT2) [Raphanus sativus]